MLKTTCYAFRVKNDTDESEPVVFTLMEFDEHVVLDFGDESIWIPEDNFIDFVIKKLKSR